jgi:hypothetical protein
VKTCHRFQRIKSGYEQDIRFSLDHAERHDGSASATTSRTNAVNARHSMAKALNRHFEHCCECG